MAALGPIPEDEPLDFTSQPAMNQGGGGPVELLDQWRGWMSRPENRAGLMQMGLQMMQPVGVGQSTIGHIAHAAGSGLEARDRNIAETEAQEQQDIRTGLAEREIAARELQAERSGGVSMNSLFRQQGAEENAFRKFVVDEAKSIAEQANDTVAISMAGGVNPYPEYAGKTPEQVRDMILSDPQKVAALRNSFNLQPGSAPGGAPPTAAPGAPGAAPAPAAAPVTLEEYIRQNPAAWQNFRNAMNSPDPAMKQKAADAAVALRGYISDPETLDEMLRE